jgi:ATP-dependent protease ClpP protease subunit
MQVQPRYLTDRCILPIVGTITREMAFHVRGELQAAVEYYGYDDVELVIDSPGGELTALDGLIADIGLLQQECVRVRTTVAGQAASAAAFLLAFGTVGHRRACPASRILIHGPRAALGGNGRDYLWTRTELARAASELEDANESLITRLARHVWAGVAKNGTLALRRSADGDRVVRTEAALCREYRRLLQEERWLDPAAALDLQLIDSIGIGPRQNGRLS